MSFQLPPLNALRALESAGRCVSFTRAADELHVTPGAISRQIRGLEESLGFALFERNHREVKLTMESQIYVEALTGAFRQMERATRQIVETRKQGHLHVHAAITFTLRWLVPRLVRFHSRHPKRDVRLSTIVPNATDLAASATDVWIEIQDARAVAALGPGLTAYPLVDVALVPVCSPGLMAELELSRDHSRWCKATRLISSARPRDWQTWMAAAGIDADPDAGIRFESSSLAYQAAIEGLGIAMAMHALVREDLRSGKLVIAHPLIHPTDSTFNLICSQTAASKPQIKEFRNWIVAEVERDAHNQRPVTASAAVSPVPAS